MNKTFLKKHSNLLIILFFIIAIILQFTVNSKKENNNQQSEKVDIIPQVLVSNIQSFNYVEKLNYYGITEPLKYSDIKSKRNGSITNIYIENGDYVEKGTLLLEIENDGLQEKINSLESKIAELKIQKNSSKDLFKNNLISESEYITVESDYQQALSDLAITKKEFNDTIIKAPYSGYINDFDRENGEVISNNETIATISDLSAIKVNVKIPEVDIFKIKRNDNALINYNKKELKGKINHIENVGSKETQTFDVEVVSNEYKNLIAGTTTKVTLYGEQYNVFKIPMHTIVLTEKGTVIRIVDEDSTVKDIPIEIITGNEEVIVKTVNDIDKENIKLITAGMYKVSNDQKVKYKEQQ